jgi:threonine dehydrogenase-like Zn-dependent dehydrogenase
MLAAVFHGPHDIRLEDIPEPSPKADEVLVRVLQAGICGSDLNRFHYGSHPWPPGFIMGHEFCGEIAAVGSDATAWQVGQRVVVEPTIYCGSCFYCQQGYYNRCIDFVTRGITGSGTNGGFAEYGVYRPINLIANLRHCHRRWERWWSPRRSASTAGN